MSFNLNVILDKEDDVKVEKFSLDKGNYNEMRNKHTAELSRTDPVTKDRHLVPGAVFPT